MADWLEAIPRIDLVHGPTPLEPLDRLSEYFRGPRLWIKRDDCTGLATGGNKTRKLEYLLADALQQNAESIITFGAMQSNHARQTAAACAMYGLDCHLVLSRSVDWPHPDYETGGNVLLDDLLGATIHRSEPDDAQDTYRALREELTGRGKAVYVIPPGGSNALGALGYVGCAREILGQSSGLGFTPDLIIHATSSGGTQAGLMVGIADAKSDCSILGINVSDDDVTRITTRVESLAANVAAISRLPPAGPLVAQINHDYLGDGYGQPTQEMRTGVRMLAEIQGIITDPVYSGKAFGALVALAQKHELDEYEHVVFVHTGGVIAHAVYEAAFHRPAV